MNKALRRNTVTLPRRGRNGGGCCRDNAFQGTLNTLSRQQPPHSFLSSICTPSTTLCTQPRSGSVLPEHMMSRSGVSTCRSLLEVYPAVELLLFLPQLTRSSSLGLQPDGLVPPPDSAHILSPPSQRSMVGTWGVQYTTAAPLHTACLHLTAPKGTVTAISIHVGRFYLLVFIISYHVSNKLTNVFTILTSSEIHCTWGISIQRFQLWLFSECYCLFPHCSWCGLSTQLLSGLP